MDVAAYALGKKYTQKLQNLLVEPSGFTWTNSPLHGKVFLNSQGYYTTYDYVPTIGKCYYVNDISGNDSNDGLTPSTALLSVATALAKADVNTIVICDKTYYNFITNGTTITKSVNIVALNGIPKPMHNYQYTVLSKTAGYNYVYQTVVANASTVVDINQYDSDGDYLKFTSVGSIALVDSTPNSYYFDGTTFYVNCNNGAATSGLVFVNNSRNAFEVSGAGVVVYLENINVIGGVKVSGNATIIAKKCKFIHSQIDDDRHGNFINFGGNSILISCTAAKSNDDGFIYQADAKGIEINCKGYKNGKAGETIDNGSTGHNGCKIIRVNGDYHDNYGPNVADVLDGCQSWNLGCKSYSSKVSGSGQSSDFQVQGQTGTASMWLDGCSTTSTTSDYSLCTDTTGNLYIRNLKDIKSYSSSPNRILPY